MTNFWKVDLMQQTQNVIAGTVYIKTTLKAILLVNIWSMTYFMVLPFSGNGYILR